MSPTNSEPTTEPRPDGEDVDEDVPPWPERGPEIAAARSSDDDPEDIEDTTVPPPGPEPIPMPGPDPVPEPIPQPGPDPAPPPGPDPRPGPVPQPPGPDPVPQPGPDPAPEPGPVADTGPVPQAVGTDEGAAVRDEDVDDVVLVLHEQPEAGVTIVDGDVDVDLGGEAVGDDEYLDDLDGADDLDGGDDEVVAAAAVAAAGAGTDLGTPVEPAPPALAEVVGGPLLPDAGLWEERWTAVQAAFVDDPGRSIQQADGLVTEAMEELARILLAQRERLQDSWRSGGEAPPDTEQLRVAVQGYRALLFGLLSA